MLDEISSRILAVAADPKLLAGSGLLFHGTAEPFDELPDAVGGDNLLWHARSPLIAQTYICSSGISALVSRPYDHRLDERVWPNKNSFWTDFAVTDMGFALPDVEHDANGNANSWSTTMPWPTYRDCLAKLQALGYPFKTDEVVKQTWHNGKLRVMPEAWRTPGRVFVTLDTDLRFADFSIGESDLTEKAHLRFDRFEMAEKSGFSGVVIDDYAQSDDCGNVPHLSFGLFARAVRTREFLLFEAVHREMDGARSQLTEDFLNFAAALDLAKAPAP